MGRTKKSKRGFANPELRKRAAEQKRLNKIAKATMQPKSRAAAVNDKGARAVQQHAQLATQQMEEMTEQAAHAALEPLQQAVAALRHEQQAMRACHRNGLCCSGSCSGSVPILWPCHHVFGASMSDQIAGQPRPATRDEVQEAAADVVDAMLSWYGLQTEPSAGGLQQRRKELLAHVGIYV